MTTDILIQNTGDGRLMTIDADRNHLQLTNDTRYQGRMAYKFEQLEVWKLALEHIAEGSTSQSDPEQARFLGFAIRSLMETVACQHIIKQRGYLKDPKPLQEAYQFREKLFAKLQAFRKNLLSDNGLRTANPAMFFQ